MEATIPSSEDTSTFDPEQNQIKLDEAQQLYKELKDEDLPFDEEFWYWIYMDQEADLKVLEKTSQLKFPKIK